MSTEAATVVYDDGMLCIAQTDTLNDEPTRLTWIWPVQRIARSDAEWILGEPASYHGDGSYSVRKNYQTIGLPLAQRGQTQALRIERTPIPCPKVRAGIPTRFRNGRWEKCLKSSGWIPA